MESSLERAAWRQVVAFEILRTLQVMERWSEVGRPVLVGAAAYGLMVAPDIDVETFCDQPSRAAGLAVMAHFACDPRIKEVRLVDELDGPDMGLYCRLRYKHESGEIWKLDMWLLAADHPGPLSRDLVVPMRQVLTTEHRVAILSIKEHLRATGTSAARSIDVYQAVLAAGVQSPEAFEAWDEQVDHDGLVAWRPNPASSSR